VRIARCPIGSPLYCAPESGRPFRQRGANRCHTSPSEEKRDGI
jgi:hypothetical protein